MAIHAGEECLLLRAPGRGHQDALRPLVKLLHQMIQQILAAHARVAARRAQKRDLPDPRLLLGVPPDEAALRMQVIDRPRGLGVWAAVDDERLDPQTLEHGAAPGEEPLDGRLLEVYPPDAPPRLAHREGADVARVDSAEAVGRAHAGASAGG